MSRVKNLISKLRDNWKKTVFGSAAFAYGISYGNEKYNKSCLMRKYCESAVQFGDVPISMSDRLRHITVILNPAANRRQAKSDYENYCAPILNLSGALVDVVQTKGEDDARNLIENLSTETDAIIVAGGDGTVSDVVTGLFRRFDGNVHKALKIPIGILPLGRTNSVIKSLVKIDENELREQILADASMNIVNEKTKRLDLIRIDLLESNPDRKPVYSVSSVEWGALRNADANRDKYWYYGTLRHYMAYIFHGTPKPVVDAEVLFTPPCSGCKDCLSSRPDLVPESDLSKRWWHYFLPVASRQSNEKRIDYSSIVNPDCSKETHKKIQTINLSVTTSNVESQSAPDVPAMKVYVADSEMPYLDFVKKGFNRIKDQIFDAPEVIEVQSLELQPAIDSEDTAYLSIDNEPYEVKPIKLTLLPKSINVFCS